MGVRITGKEHLLMEKMDTFLFFTRQNSRCTINFSLSSLMLILLLTGLFSTGKAQQYGFSRYGIEDGLPQSEVFDIIQARDGALWIATNGGGMCRFNGKKFKVYSKKSGLNDNIIADLFEDSKGNLWIGTSKGISVFDGYGFKHYMDSSGFGNSRYLQIHEGKNGKIWMVNRENQNNFKILKLDKGEIVDFTAQHDLLTENNTVFGLFGLKNGEFLISTTGGLYELNDGDLKYSRLNTLPLLRDKFINPLFEDERGALYIVAFTGTKPGDFYKFHNGILEEIPYPRNLPFNLVNAFHVDSQDRIWISFFGEALVMYHDNEFKIFNQRNGLPSNHVNNIMEDKEGNIWLGTNGSGLIKYSGKKFIAYNFNKYINGNIVRCIHQDETGNYWFGVAGNGLIKFDGGNYSVFPKEEYPRLRHVRKMIDLPNGHLLIGTFNGNLAYDGSKFYNYLENYGISPNIPVMDILKDGDELWFGTLLQGVKRVNTRTREILDFNLSNDSLKNNVVQFVYKDSRGSIWFCTNYGVSVFNGTRVKHYNPTNGFNSEWVLQATEDLTGTMWFATYDNGLIRLKNDSITEINSLDGLTSDNIYSVITDLEGNVWAGTQNGVDKIFLDDEGNIQSIENYDRHDGFTGIENNGSAAIMDREGSLWFGTINGAMKYNPGKDKVNPHPPVTSITDIRLFFREVDWAKKIHCSWYDSITPWMNLPVNLKLPYNKNHVSFDFEGISYKVPEKVSYQWKMNGLDKEWSPVSHKTEAVYTNLPPGEYTFMVKASNEDGIWNETPSTYTFSIAPPWWQTWGFIALAVLVITGLIILIFQLRLRAINRRNKLLELQVNEKTAEIQAQKEEIVAQSEKIKKSFNDLENLTNIGKLITANLYIEKINDIAYESINKLMDATAFGIGVYDETKNAINFPGAMEKGKKIGTLSYPLEEKERFAVLCYTGKKEIFINDLENEYKKYFQEMLPPKTDNDSKSIIYLPLVGDDRTLGVITVQSFKKNAYSLYHLNILRNLAVYAKIAIENASAYAEINQQKENLRVAKDNIDEQKSQIESKNKELVNLNKEKNHLIGIIAHELRNPLTSLLSMVNTLKSNKDECTEEQLETFAYMQKVLSRMNKMVSKILDIRVIESKELNVKFEKINLASIVKAIDCLYQPIASKKDIRLQTNTIDARVEIDKGFATQVLDNLVSNAIKFSPVKKSVLINMNEQNGQVMVEVKDEGPGLTPEDKKKLFEKFQVLSAKPTGGEKSIGLGLSIVKRYVEAMNGKVWCESTPGKGATFVVQFNKTK